MAKSLNPMEAFRREQKKKELKKHRLERQKDKQAKLGAMDPAELRAQLKNLERQVAINPTDGPTRKRKQELEDTLRAVVKKQKEVGSVNIYRTAAIRGSFWAVCRVDGRGGAQEAEGRAAPPPMVSGD